MSNSGRIIARIVRDIRGRKGIGDEWESIDDSIQDEIIDKWKRFFNESATAADSGQKGAHMSSEEIDKLERTRLLRSAGTKIGPADAMSALEPEFQKAYAAATEKIMTAVLEFERVTGRVVYEISINYLDVTTLQDESKQWLRTAFIDFLPTPGELHG